MRLIPTLTVAVAIVIGSTLVGEAAPSAGKQSATPSPAVTALKAKARELLSQGRHDDLEKLASGLRALPCAGEYDPTTGGLSHFYDGLTETDDYEALLGRLQRWANSKPQSITPRCAMLQALTAYAWEARGGGRASTVTDEGWRLFRERLKRAQTVVDEALRCKAGPGDVHFYAEWLILGKGLGYPETLERKIYEQGRSISAIDPALIGAMTSYLLPRWYGKPDSISKLATEALRGPMGHETYALITSTVCSFEMKKPIETASLDSSHALQGFDKLTKRFPKSINLRHCYAYVALQARDRQLVRELLGAVPPDHYNAIWRSPEFYRKVRDWALGPGK